MYSVKEPGEQLWQVAEKSTHGSIYGTRKLYARNRRHAKVQYAAHYKQFLSSILTAVPVCESEEV